MCGIFCQHLSISHPIINQLSINHPSCETHHPLLSQHKHEQQPCVPQSPKQKPISRRWRQRQPLLSALADSDVDSDDLSPSAPVTTASIAPSSSMHLPASSLHSSALQQR